jgi:hypothetical protein
MKSMLRVCVWGALLTGCSGAGETDNHGAEHGAEAKPKESAAFETSAVLLTALELSPTHKIEFRQKEVVLHWQAAAAALKTRPIHDALDNSRSCSTRGAEPTQSFSAPSALWF